MTKQSELLPLISVRIPAYNHEQFIVETLDSVRMQSYPNKEIVIIDDGSTDNTAGKIKDWIKKYRNKIPVNFKSRENKGVSATINELIKMSRGDFLVGLASDDKLLPESLFLRYKYLKSNPNKMAVFGDSQVIDSNGNILYESGLSDLHSADKKNFLNDHSLKVEIITNWSVTGSVIMMRKSLHNKMRYNETLQIEDRDFYLKMVSQNLLGFIDYPVSAYRLHNNNTCMNKRNLYMASVNKFRTLLFNINKFPISDRYLFIYPLTSSFFGIVFHFINKTINKHMKL